MRHPLARNLLIVAGALAAASPGEPATADPARINVPNWVGFAPLFVAQEKGFFTNHGVEVVFSSIDSARECYPLLIGGKLDLSAGEDRQSLISSTPMAS